MSKKYNWKADEMEMSINFRAVRCSWIFLEVGLLVFSIVYSIADGSISLLSSVPFIMVMASFSVFWFVKSYYTKQMSKVETEDDEE